MKQSLAVLILVLLFSCGEKNKENTTTSETKTMESTTRLSNKLKAIAVLESLETGDKKAVSHINPKKYIQHNLAVGDGLSGFGAVLQNAPEGGFKAKVIRAFEDGEYVFTHTIYDFFGPKIGFDIFRFENGLIVEHWDNLIEKAPANPSNRTQTDGPTSSKGLEKTETNKAIVKDFVSTILMKGEMDKLSTYIDNGKENYIQHNPAIGDGLSGLGKALEDMAKQGLTMEYDTLHKVLGEGNFVLTISEGQFAGQHTSFYDLFRVENNKIIEHWDVIEPIASKETWKNSNGKFNF